MVRLFAPTGDFLDAAGKRRTVLDLPLFIAAAPGAADRGRDAAAGRAADPLCALGGTSGRAVMRELRENGAVEGVSMQPSAARGNNAQGMRNMRRLRGAAGDVGEGCT